MSLALVVAVLGAGSGARMARGVLYPTSTEVAHGVGGSFPLAKAPAGLQEAVSGVLAGPSDVLAQQGSKLAPGMGEESPTVAFGQSVALSTDGDTALIGSPDDSTAGPDAGAAWVFVRSGSTWVQQGPALLPDDELGQGRFGVSVALSADGNTALIGGSGSNGAGGAAWVFTRAGSTWTQDGPKLTATATPGPGGTVAASEFGSVVALSGDGNTALVGNYADNADAGAVYIFARSGATWTQEGPKLTPSDEELDRLTNGGSAFGYGAALSYDGTTALIGGFFDNNAAGAAWVYTDTGGTWNEQAKLTGGGESGQGLFGSSVALSSDGNTALVGGYGDGAAGSAWVFTRSGSTWAQEGPKITPNDSTGAANFGISVALSGEGDTALIGGNTDNGEVGAAWVFTESAGNWTQQGAKLVGDDVVGRALSGTSVALSSDGTTSLVGGPGEAVGAAGEAWVYVDSTAGWAEQGPTLLPDASPAAGLSVALSSDGNTALVGGPYANGGGAAWVYTRSGTTWTQQTTLSGCVGQFGYSVALSSDGNTALIGCPFGNSYAGSASVFTRSGSTWTEQATFTPTGEDDSGGGGEFGVSVALSSDGNTALVGAPFDASDFAGAAWVFTRTGSTWAQQGSKLTGSGEDNTGGGGLFGTAVALSGDGSTALIGGPSDGSNHAGAAWTFTNSGGAWAQQGAKLTGGGEDNSGGGGGFGDAVTLSSDGNTALIGAPFDGGANTGAVWAYSRMGAAWTGVGSKLTPSDEDNSGGGGWFGFSLALSADGTRALIGAPLDSASSAGAVWLFGNSGTSWSQLGPKTTPSDEDNSGGGGNFGFSVALSADKTTALIGGPGDGPYNAGAAWIFTVPPATTPGAPTTVTAQASSSAATVFFDAPASNGGAPITSYTVTASPGLTRVSAASSPIIVNGLTDGTSYTFTVTATNSAGTGPASAPSNAVTPEAFPPTLPGPPGPVSAVAGNGQATLIFATPSSDGGEPITSYLVTVSPGGRIVTASSSPITVSGLANGTSYTFTVAATNAVGTGPATKSNAVTPVAPAGGGGGGGGGSDGIAVTISPGTQSVSSGGTATFTVAITNTGAGYLFNVGASDPVAPNCNQATASTPAAMLATLETMAPGVTVTYSCTVTASSSLTNTVTANGIGPDAVTVTASASASVSVSGSAAAPFTPPVAGSSHGSGGASKSTGSPSLVLFSMGGLKLVVVGKTVTLHLTTKLSAATVLDLVLLDSKHHTLAHWVIHGKNGSHTFTLWLPSKARLPGHDELQITQAGAKTPKTLPVLIKA